MKVLLIGCGMIGALYDIDNELVQTHAKALSLLEKTEVTLYDLDVQLARKVADKYGYTLAENTSNFQLREFDWVIIATATSTHMQWLSTCFDAKVPFIICEKPLSLHTAELEKIQDLYSANNSKVLVNYIRRFQPAYMELKQYLSVKQAPPTHIHITYQRGMINNFSHAADLLQFFFGYHDFKNVTFFTKKYDTFDNDPTSSFSADYKGIPLSIAGLANVVYAYFTIELYYDMEKVSIENSGSSILIKSVGEPGKNNKALFVIKEQNNLLDKYMLQVYGQALKMYRHQEEDNFMESIKMNKQLLKLI